ncbi:hypothetical protein ACQP2P_29865 [Dactylosporangium sp. CA-139114]|uniref:hypothetical protein n=1 Tax=Dactylosporangium sp. CA-139114 TaxID=3239931 RepID=UPI003D952D75
MLHSPRGRPGAGSIPRRPVLPRGRHDAEPGARAGDPGRAYRYGALSDPAGLVANRISRLLSAESGRASVLPRFVSGLSERDERLLTSPRL